MESPGAIQISSSIEPTSQTPKLEDLARSILERDRLAVVYAHSQWLENGRDLLEAKAILVHGDFGEWCKRQLSYSPRTAQKLMQAADVWGPWLKSESGSVLLKPTIVYLLSAPSVSQEIREVYVPRVIAGEDVAVELRSAIKDQRDSEKKAKERRARLAAKSAEARQAQAQREKAKARREAREAEERRVEQERQATACSTALALIQARFGDDLPALIALAAEAGSGSVFSFAAERELQTLAQVKTTLVEDEAGIVADEPEVADVETVPSSCMSEVGPPASSIPMNTADEEHAAGPGRQEAVAADMPLLVPNASPRAGTGKFADLASVVRQVEAARREKRPKFKQQNGQA